MGTWWHVRTRGSWGSVVEHGEGGKMGTWWHVGAWRDVEMGRCGDVGGLGGMGGGTWGDIGT